MEKFKSKSENAKKKLLVFSAVFVCFAFIFASLSSVVAISEEISSKVLRLHILANSDSALDQELKLKVRDGVIDLSEEVFSQCTTLQSAKTAALKNLNNFQYCAKEILKSNDCDYAVSAVLTKEYFSTRHYENFTLPAGVYSAVRIVIGSGKGHNWWCVMFPQVCLSGCVDDFESTLSGEEVDFVSSDCYTVKFKAVEIYEKIKSKISS